MEQRPISGTESPHSRLMTTLLLVVLSVTLLVPAGQARGDESGSASPDPSPSVSPTPSPSPSDSQDEPSTTPSPEPTVAAPQTDAEALATPKTSSATFASDGFTVSVPEVARRGATVKATINTGGSQNGTGRMWYRTGPKWVESSLTFTITNGKGTVSWVPETSRSYRIETSFGATSPVFSVSKEDTSRRAVKMNFTAPDYVAAEIVWLRGYTYKSGKGYKAKVLIERRALSGTTWSTYKTVNSNTAGYFSYKLPPSASYVYRARINNTWAYSGPVSLNALPSDFDRTLEDRAVDLAWLLGSPKAGIGNVAEANLPSGVSSARYRDYTRGTLVEVTASGSTRTWLVWDRIGEHYTKSGRWKGQLGLPMRDHKCGLLEGGCVQRFRGGSLYQNTSKMSRKVYVAYGSVVETEILATARSQTGYEEPAWRKNKYNTWVKGNAAWCSVFVSWAGAASGNATTIPKKKTYAAFLSTMVASGRLHYSGTPPVGAVVLFDWGSGTPTHSGFVRGHAKDRIATVEGNTSDGSGDPQRGVYERTRYVSDVWAWFMPSEK